MKVLASTIINNQVRVELIELLGNGLFIVKESYSYCDPFVEEFTTKEDAVKYFTQTVSEQI